MNYVTKLTHLYALVLFSLITYVPSVGAQTTIAAGPVAGIWTSAGSPYLIAGDVTVEAGFTLTVEAGVEILFTDAFGMVVEGRLNFQGTATDSIYCRPQPDGVSDFWKGIEILPASGTDSTVISHAVFSGARRGDDYPLISFDPADAGGALRIAGRPNVRISDCTFTENWSGFSGPAVACLDGANIVFQRNAVTSNEYCGKSGGLEIADSRVMVLDNYFNGNSGLNGHCLRIVDQTEGTLIRGNRFEDNGGGGTQQVVGAVFVHFGGSALIEGNEFYGNTAQQSGGAITANPEGGVTIVNNWFEGNSVTGDGLNDPDEYAYGNGGAISCNRCEILNNVFVGNVGFWGGAVHAISPSEVVNNLFYDNYAITSGGAVLTTGTGVALTNNIFWANTTAGSGSQITIGSIATAFKHNIIETGQGGLFEVEEFTNGDGIGVYQNNLESPPLFEDAVTFDFELQAESPAIDGGTQEGVFVWPTDYNGNARITGQNIDIGPFEFDPVARLEGPTAATAGFRLYPNPARTTVSIDLDESIDREGLAIQLIDGTGSTVAEWESVGIIGTHHTLSLPASVRDGVYLLCLTGRRGFVRTATLLIKK